MSLPSSSAVPVPQRIHVQQSTMSYNPPSRTPRQMTTIEASSLLSTTTATTRRCPNPFSAASTSLRRLSQDKRRTHSPTSTSYLSPPPQRQIAKVPSTKSAPPLQTTYTNTSSRIRGSTREFSYVSDDKENNSLSTVPSLLATPNHSQGQVQVTRPHSNPLPSQVSSSRPSQAGSSHHRNQHYYNQVYNNTKVPLWIPIDERVHWIADTPSLEYVSSGSMSSTQNTVTGGGRNETASTVPPIDPTMLHAKESDYHHMLNAPATTMRARIRGWKLFQFPFKKGQTTTTGNNNNGEGLPSARRSFRSNKKGIARLFRRREREMENRMSVDRDVYNNGYQ